MTIVSLLVLLALVSSLFFFFLGLFLGKHFERVAWNELVEGWMDKGMIPRPKRRR